MNLKKDAKYGLGKDTHAVHTLLKCPLKFVPLYFIYFSAHNSPKIHDVCVCCLGFQVVGGEDSGRADLGTIISSITPGGPADVNGSLKPGASCCPPPPGLSGGVSSVAMRQ